MDGQTVVGTDTSKSPVSGCVFGGGNAAATGTDVINNSTSTVNIAGGTIYGNVYGGANTSVIYGYTVVNIGYDSINDTSLQKNDIYIKGTIFGGGESNAGGSGTFDYDFISVTNGINININGTGHDSFKTEGSIFGSGDASNTNGSSYINIASFGTIDNPQKNISIQRATTVVIDKSVIVLNGTTDSTDDYFKDYFSVNRIGELKLKNNSTLYMNYGANLLEKLSSLVDINGTEQKGVVTVAEDGTTTRNVDNRIYLKEGKNLNVARDKQITDYGEVKGMFFLGLFTNANSPNSTTGFYYNGYKNGDYITNEGTFSNNSYVLGMHLQPVHDITQDGFYTNYDENGYIKTKYIEPTPEDALYYIWLVGEGLDVVTFDISLTASKYATLGTYELALKGFETPNTKFNISGFSAGLIDGVSLIDKKDVEPIALNTDTANSVFGLYMKNGKNGWQTDSATNFYTASGGNYSGSNAYNHDNSGSTPTLSFYLYHSENLTEEQELGEVIIRFQVLTPIDDWNYKISYIDVNITMLTALYQDYYYEAAIAPGEEFDLFTTTGTNITNRGKLTTYYSLYIDNFSSSTYAAEYANCNRVLISKKLDSANNTSYPMALPAGTKITMLDQVQNKYYYYIVTAQDESSGKYIYQISDFVEMGSDNRPFDEEAASNIYHDTSQDLVYESFLFHLDFKECNIQQDMSDNTLLMELQDPSQNTILGVLGIQRDTIKYSVYTNKDASINVGTTINNNILYLGKSVDINISTNFVQNLVASQVIYDTKFFDDQMGIKISIYDNNGNQLANESLLGVDFIINGKIYYPSIDGGVRIKIADKVSNVITKLTIDTKNNTTLATGLYKIKIEAFGSPDGICYGTELPDYTDIPITIINGAYGLKVITNDDSKILDKETGNILNGSNILSFSIEYSSGLENPNIALVLERRNYDTPYAKDYEEVDLEDYISEILSPAYNQYEYMVTNAPAAINQFSVTMKNNLETGTYRLVFRLYDNNTYIGEAYEYIIIK